MKYLVVGLLLLASLIRPPASPLLPPSPTYATASFDVAAPPGTETGVDLYVSLNAPTDWLALRVTQTRQTCEAGACQEVVKLYGFTREQIEPAVATIDPRLTRAWVHATVPVADDVSRTTIPIRVDVLWTATGTEQCDAVPLNGYGAPDCVRTASALGAVWTATSVLIGRQTVPDGTLRTNQ